MNLTHNSGWMQRRLPIVQELPLRPQDETECRRCGIHCDKVVYPAACVTRACPFLYAYEEWGHTYIGCMQKVYDVEIDLDALQEAQKRKGGFGAVKTVRQPLPMCKAEVATCYEHRADELGCVNPEFFALPRGRPAACRPGLAFFTPRLWRSRSFWISFASGPWPSGPGTSRIVGSPCSFGWPRKTLMPAAISPSPRFAWRSRFEPRVTAAAFTCSARSRARPICFSPSSPQ